MKVVINHCCGGFCLSQEALERFAELEGHQVFYYRYMFRLNGNKPSDSDYYKKVPRSERNDISVDAFIHDYGDNILKSAVDFNHKLSPYIQDRTNPNLVRVVEELGEDANGDSSNLKILDIPDGGRVHNRAGCRRRRECTRGTSSVAVRRISNDKTCTNTSIWVCHGWSVRFFSIRRFEWIISRR